MRPRAAAQRSREVDEVNCPECGKSINPGSSYCPYCGANVPAVQGDGQDRVPQPPVGPPPAASPSVSPLSPPGVAPGTLPPPPGKHKMSQGWKIAIIVIITAVLLIGALAVVLGVFVFKTVKAPVDVTNRYIEAINTGRAQEAWDLLSPDSSLRQEYDFSSFQTDVVQPSIDALTTWNAHQASVSGSQAEVGVDMSFSDGSSNEEFTFQLRKTGDRWLIYNYFLP